MGLQSISLPQQSKGNYKLQRDKASSKLVFKGQQFAGGVQAGSTCFTIG